METTERNVTRQGIGLSPGKGMQSHSKFYKTLADKERGNLAQCVSRMALELSPPEGLVGMDRQLFDIVLNDENERVISALNPIARRAILAYHGVGPD